MAKRIVGIDLGTTTSAISFLYEGKPEIIANAEGENITDSAVTTDKYGNIIVGSIAKRDRVSIREIKRLMGTNEKVTLNGKRYTPEEISAEILKKLKMDAEEYLGEEIEEAVITVPAMFTTEQKAATKKAGELAGFKVERLISEPTAAALAYSYENLDKKCKILVYDFGGGTFDVSILDYQDGILEVLACEGDNHLGGKDLDDIVADYVIKEATALGKIVLEKGKEDIEYYKMLLDAENLKKAISTKQISSFISPINDIDIELTRVKFEELIKNKIEESFECVEKALRFAKMTKEDIDIVLPVGGTTRIPIIKERLKGMFGLKVKNFKNPQEVVSMGAAVQGAIKAKEILPEAGIIITDIISYSLGTSIQGIYKGKKIDGIYSKIIHKGLGLPCRESCSYVTASNNQTSVRIDIYQGEMDLVQDNHYIGDFVLKGIPANKAGSESIKVTFDFDLNSVLTVEAEVVSTGAREKHIYDMGGKFVSIAMDNSKNSNNIEITSKDFLYKNSRLYDDYKMIIEISEKKLKNLSGDDKKKVEEILEKMKKALINENSRELEKLDMELTDLVFSL